MRIDGQLPTHIARAYGLRPTQPVRPAQPIDSSQPVGRIQPQSTTSRAGELGAARLVAGSVPGQVNFDGSATLDPNQAGTLQLYTRAADKLEAAIGVHLGRSLDVSG